MSGRATRTDRRKLAAWTLASAVLIGGTAVAALAAKKGRDRSAEAAEKADAPEPYLRIDRSDAPRLRLQIALRKFEPADGQGPPIWLTAVAHLGEPDYYDALQQHLDARGRVLFEGVGLPAFLRKHEDDNPAARAHRTRAALRYVAARLHGHRERHGSLPESLDRLHKELEEHNSRAAWWTRAAMTDAWDRPLQYEPAGETFTLRSLGRDGEPGGTGPDAEIRFDDQPPLQDAELNPKRAIQADLAEALGLVFQFDALNYDRPHFRHSDLSMPSMRRALAGRPLADRPKDHAADEQHKSAAPSVTSQDGAQNSPDANTDAVDADAASNADEQADESPPATAGQKQLQRIAKLLDGSSIAASIMKFAFNLIDASPRLQAITRLLLIETLGQLEGDLAQARGLPKGVQQLLQVLIHQRNRAVVNDLEKALSEDNPPASISVFYGAGHMPDLEKRLRDRLNYRPTEQRWLTAFSVDREDTGLTPAETRMLRGMIQLQMKTLGR